MNKDTKTPDKTTNSKKNFIIKPMVRNVYGDGYDPSWVIIHTSEVEE